MSHAAGYEKPKIGRILLVEDEELVGRKIKQDLEKNEIQVDWATTFDQAAKLLRETDIHALITDIFITPPKADGLDLVELAKNLGIPSVIITSALDVHVAKEGLNRGADFLIEKPFEIKALMSQIMDIWENPKGLIARRERFFGIHDLTNKEREICRLILKGMMNQEIADLTGTTLGTIKFYTSQIFEKFDVKNRSELFNLIFPT